MTDKITFKHVFGTSNPGKIDDFYKFDRKKGNPLGEGSYGLVRKGSNKATGAERAIKMIQKRKVKDPAKFQVENGIQQSLDHPHIVKLYEAFEDKEFYYLVMEIAEGGELFDRITEAAEAHEGQAFSEKQASEYMGQIFGAMSYLHGEKVAHRDIKPENFLMNSKRPDAVIKVIDFGLAKRYAEGERMKTKAGTPYYVAPEVLAGDYNHTCDVWSCGVLTYILICGYPPFYGDDDREILKAVKTMKFDFPEEDWASVSRDCKEIIKSMLKRETERPEFENLLQHTWMTNHESKKVGALASDLGAKLKKFTASNNLKKMAITCIATQLKDTEIENLKNTFEALDKSKDGRLTQDEIINGMTEHGVEVPDDIRSTLAALDTDGSGQIDFTEFIAATIEESKFCSEEIMWAAFRTFDLDNDGYITKEELKKASEITDDSQIIQMIQGADTDKDGQIDFEEFKKMMRNA